MSIDKKLEYIKLLDKLSETLGDSEGQSSDDIREELQEEKFDVDTAEANFLKMQQEISMAAKRQVLDEAEKQRALLGNRINEIKRKIKVWTKDQVKNRLDDFLSADPELGVNYRNLKSKREEDIKAILIDMEIAQLMKEDKGQDIE